MANGDGEKWEERQKKPAVDARRREGIDRIGQQPQDDRRDRQRPRSPRQQRQTDGQIDHTSTAARTMAKGAGKAETAGRNLSAASSRPSAAEASHIEASVNLIKGFNR